MPFDGTTWPPDYHAEGLRRKALYEAFNSLDDPRKEFKKRYKDNPTGFIQDWCYTVDPRAGGKVKDGKKPLVVKPFLLFPKQVDLVQWVHNLVDIEENGLVEKTRGAGCTWTFCAYTVYLWLMYDDVSVGWGSRKEMLVDRKGDMDSIFEKFRFLINKLPWFARPEGLTPKVHLTFMKCENPENGSFIKGEAGDNIGRGGRSLIYFKDESAHYERADMIEAALSENTNCQVDFSSVNGVGNIFHQNRFGGVVKVFIFDTSDVPWMTEAFLTKKKTELEAKGLSHKFSQEYERDYSASVEGIVIPGKWVKAAIDAHIHLGIEPSSIKVAALDPMDEGGDTAALSFRRGMTTYRVDEWGIGDTTYASQEAVRICSEEGYGEFIYDAVGVGSGVKASMKLMNKPVNAKAYKGSWGVAFPKDIFASELRNEDVFKNLKAQSWWHVRVLFENTFKAITTGAKYDQSEMISLDSNMPLLQRLVAELSQPTRIDKQGKIMINKKPDGTKSPNLADAVVMSYSDHLINNNMLVW